MSPPSIWKRFLAEGANPELLLIGNAATALGVSGGLLLGLDAPVAVAGGAAVGVFGVLWLCLASPRTAWLPRALAFLTACAAAALLGVALGYRAFGRVGACVGGVALAGAMIGLTAAVRARDSAKD